MGHGVFVSEWTEGDRRSLWRKTPRCANTCWNCSRAEAPTRVFRTPSRIFRPKSGESGPRGHPTPRGNCWNTCASRSGTYSNFPAIRATRRRSGRKVTGLKARSPRTKKPGTEVFMPSARSWRRCVRWWPTMRPTCMGAFPMGTARRCCARPCWWPITMPTTWASWCCCGACWGRGTWRRDPSRLRVGYVQVRFTQSHGHGLGDLFVNFVDGQVAFNKNHPLGFARGDLAILLPDALIKGVVFPLESAFVLAVLLGDPVTAAPGAVETELERRQQQQGQVGLETTADKLVQLKNDR